MKAEECKNENSKFKRIILNNNNNEFQKKWKFTKNY